MVPLLSAVSSYKTDGLPPITEDEEQEDNHGVYYKHRGACLQGSRLQQNERQSTELPGAVWPPPLHPCTSRRNGPSLEFSGGVVVLRRVGA